MFEREKVDLWKKLFAPKKNRSREKHVDVTRSSQYQNKECYPCTSSE